MKDRSDILIVVMIALGLRVNAFVPLIHPAPVVAAQDIDLSNIESNLGNVESNVVGLK
jgi:hypothetical protein